jgi:glycosyltransferase involved in cell wall biosynthesis
LKVLFVLPSLAVAGGVKTTVEMANRLSVRDEVEILILNNSYSGVRRSVSFLFERKIERARIAVPLHFERSFTSGEASKFDVIVAVGTFTIEYVRGLRTNARKCRWCKGFSEHRSNEMKRVWGYNMPTAAVSEPLVKPLEDLSGKTAWGVVPNGIELGDYFVEAHARNGIGTIYNNNPKKAPEDIILICDQLRRQYPNVPLRAFGACRRPSSLNVTEYCLNANIATARRLYNQSLVWFIASKSEGFCNPILEAMACGAAVVVSRHDSATGIVRDGVNGLLVNIGDVNNFCEVIGELLTNSGKRSELIENSIETIRSFSWQSAVNRMRNFLSDVEAGWEAVSIEKDGPTPCVDRFSDGRD